MKRLAALTLILVSLSFTTDRAHAQEAADVARAKQLQVEGLKLLDKSDPGGALEKFDAAYALVPSPKVIFNKGRAHEALGNDLEALSAFETFLAAPNMPQPARQDAQHRVEKLRGRVSFLAVSGPSGAEVFLDDQAKGQLPIEAAFAMAPGQHEVRLQRNGQELHRQTVQARPGATINVNVVVESQTIIREPSPALVSPQPQPAWQPQQLEVAISQPKGDQASGWVRPAAWITAGLAVAAISFGSIEQLRASSKANEFDDFRQAPLTGDGKCGEAAPQAGGGACTSLLGDYEKAQDLALAGFIAGGVLAAGAATLFWLSMDRSPAQEAGPSLSCAPNFLNPGALCSARF